MASPDPVLRRAICARASEFEIGALLDLLASLGYQPADIAFRGHATETPQPTLVHRVEFAEPSAVTITVNLGLRSCRSPLPSYFQHLLRDTALQEPLVELLQLIDRDLLRSRLTCDRPERVIAAWGDMAGDLVRIHGLDSQIGLHWLFRHVFPELPVVVARTSDELRVPYAAAWLGGSQLGSACLGATAPIDVHDFQVTLRCVESLVRPGVPWLHEVDHRLRAVVFPALAPVAMNLTIVLELADDQAYAVLRDDRPPPRESYLGMDPLGALDGPARRVVMYRGLLPAHQPDTDALERMLAAQLAITVTAIAHDPQSCELGLALVLASGVHHYRATVRWGVRSWQSDEPHVIDLRYDGVPQAAPTARLHPRLWTLLRDHARRSMA